VHLTITVHHQVHRKFFITLYIYHKMPLPVAARCKDVKSTAARLLGLGVRIPPGAWMSACCECCVLSGRGLCDELITRPEESYRLWCVQLVWMWSVDHEEALANWGLSRHGGGEYNYWHLIMAFQKPKNFVYSISKIDKTELWVIFPTVPSSQMSQRDWQTKVQSVGQQTETAHHPVAGS
jgi:hypothetical protein